MLFRSNLSNALRIQLKTKFTERSRTFIYIGCSWEELKQHIEKLFQPGMSWENYGRKKDIKCWHIDHIIPKSWFKVKNEDGTINDAEMKKCWNWQNLQPMWAEENIRKSNRHS